MRSSFHKRKSTIQDQFTNLSNMFSISNNYRFDAYVWGNHSMGPVQALNVCISLTQTAMPQKTNLQISMVSKIHIFQFTSEVIDSQLISQVSTYFPVFEQNYFLLRISFVSPFALHRKTSTLPSGNEICFRIIEYFIKEYSGGHSVISFM